MPSGSVGTLPICCRAQGVPALFPLPRRTAYEGKVALRSTHANILFKMILAGESALLTVSLGFGEVPRFVGGLGAGPHGGDTLFEDVGGPVVGANGQKFR
jgi:hypothetical protein